MHQNLAWLQTRNYIPAEKGMLIETKKTRCKLNCVCFRAAAGTKKTSWMAASHWGVWPKLFKSYIFSSCKHDTTMARPHPPPAPHYFWLLPQWGVMSVHKDHFLSFMGLTALPANAHPIYCHWTLLALYKWTVKVLCRDVIIIFTTVFSLALDSGS